MLSQLTFDDSSGAGDAMATSGAGAFSDARYGRYTSTPSTSVHCPSSAAGDMRVIVCGSASAGGGTGPSSEMRRPVTVSGVLTGDEVTASSMRTAFCASSSVGAQPSATASEVGSSVPASRSCPVTQ